MHGGWGLGFLLEIRTNQTDLPQRNYTWGSRWSLGFEILGLGGYSSTVHSVGIWVSSFQFRDLRSAGESRYGFGCLRCRSRVVRRDPYKLPLIPLP